MKLHTISRFDIDRLGTWLPDVAKHAGYAHWTTVDALDKSVGNPRVLTNGGSSAFIALELATPMKNAAQINFLAVAPNQRRLGIGGRVALSVERRLKSKTKQIYTLVPSSIGLALYFWLRLGYRPLVRKDSVQLPSNDTSVWMVRDLYPLRRITHSRVRMCATP